MAKIVNLRRARKARARDAARAEADANAARHGTPTALRRLGKARREKAAREHEAHRMGPEEDERN
jgi:hypothetical protein